MGMGSAVIKNDITMGTEGPSRGTETRKTTYFRWKITVILQRNSHGVPQKFTKRTARFIMTLICLSFRALVVPHRPDIGPHLAEKHLTRIN
jgi:hypothetical protein